MVKYRFEVVITSDLGFTHGPNPSNYMQDITNLHNYIALHKLSSIQTERNNVDQINP